MANDKFVLVPYRPSKCLRWLQFPLDISIAVHRKPSNPMLVNWTQTGHLNMERQIRSNLENRTNRLKMPVARKPEYVRIGAGLSLGYRRNATDGTWILESLTAKEAIRRRRLLMLTTTLMLMDKPISTIFKLRIWLAGSPHSQMWSSHCRSVWQMGINPPLPIMKKWKAVQTSKT
jgi:hypothetical protein